MLTALFDYLSFNIMYSTANCIVKYRLDNRNTRNVNTMNKSNPVLNEKLMK